METTTKTNPRGLQWAEDERHARDIGKDRSRKDVGPGPASDTDAKAVTRVGTARCYGKSRTDTESPLGYASQGSLRKVSWSLESSKSSQPTTEVETKIPPETYV